MTTSDTSDRIVALDVLRGVAVMGILAANLPAFALPEAAYFSPAAWGGTAPADVAAWAATYVLVEGKMRGLFALLFGASMLLVVDRAEAAGRSGVTIHYRRMAWLFVIGLLHLYGLWWGDILAHYALCGAIAFPFRRLPVRGLVIAAAVLVAWDAAQGIGLLSALRAAEMQPDGQGRALLAGLASGFGIPPAAELAAEIRAYRGDYLHVFGWRLDHASNPLVLLLYLGPETLATMLLGMAGLRSGFLTGRWSRAHYRRWALVGLGVALPAYGAVAWHTATGDFALGDVVFGSMVAPVLLRWPAIAGYAALILLLVREDGPITARIAAAGRTALTNYLATTLLMTTISYGYGFGQFGRVDRGTLLLIALPAWAAMLAWSQPWLVRFRHGPAEWLWRCLARGRVEPILQRDDLLLRPMRK